MPINYTIQDSFSLLLAIVLFTTVAVFPGFVIGSVLDIFSFKRRTLLAQYVIAIALSSALVPAILFLPSRFVSNQFAIGIVLVFLVSWAGLQLKLRTNYRFPFEVKRWQKVALVMGGAWIVFCICLLVDIQIGKNLYFNAAAYDFTTRTALIEAITRTGIPLTNPSYYPGHFEKITALYYFWYIQASVVDTLGGGWVDARIALFAGITWAGLSLMATIATYLRIRNHQSGVKTWRASIIGCQLVAVSGLDFVPVMAMMLVIKTTFGVLPFDARIEGWNIPVISWLNAVTWVPNHVSSVAACIVALLALLSSLDAKKIQRLGSVIVAGISIGSALGLSIWVTLTFGLFMIAWGVAILLNKSSRPLFGSIAASGILGLALVSPYLLEILQSEGTSGSAGGLPIAFYVRHFWLTGALAPGVRDIFGVLLLPVNYFFELGFFFVIAMIWFRQRRKRNDWPNNQYFLAETLLFAIVIILLSFVRSTVLAINDLGMRAWLLGQFILIIWAIDIFNASPKDKFLLTATLFRSPLNTKRINDLLTLLLIVGMLTTALEAVSTRFWTILIDTGFAGVPNEVSPDTNLGRRTYDARLAYEYIRDHTPQDLIVQNNPITVLDRPSGLYGTRQMVIGDRTAYGVPAKVFKEMSTSVGRIFVDENVTDWIAIDKRCSQYSIQAIIINDTDPLWSSLPSLKEQRTPIYINEHYAVFRCGSGE